MNRLPTLEWLVTRFELALGAIAVVLVIVYPIVRPQFMGQPAWYGHELALWIGGANVAIGAFLWMLRIMRRSPEAGPSPRRYRGH